MFLFLVHHGAALDADVDSQRPLSAAGRLATERGAREAAARGARPAVVWHSGKLRARQTAEAFWKASNPLAEFSAVRGLQPTDPPEWIRDQLEGEARDVMLVGHLPHLARLRRLLVGESSPDTATDFPAHGVVALEGVAGHWLERWRVSVPA